MTKETWLILAVALVVFIVAAVGIGVRKKHRNIVKKHSVRLQELRGLNQRTVFYGGEYKEYEYHQTCNSKRQFDNLELEEYLITLLDENQGDFATRLNQIACNRKNYAAYIKTSESIVSVVRKADCENWKIPYKTFLKHEKRLFKKSLVKKPLTEIAVKCVASYTSPQGKNHYEKEHTYDYEQLQYYFERLTELKETRKTRQYQIKIERAKMTDSLRYDIMKRDNFRCQLCGSTAADGVKLHVDHILPVAKGGKTKPENLRTLCDRCNMGKSDKYE